MLRWKESKIKLQESPDAKFYLSVSYYVKCRCKCPSHSVKIDNGKMKAIAEKIK